MIDNKYVCHDYVSHSWRKGQLTKQQWEYTDDDGDLVDFQNFSGREFIVTGSISKDSLGRELLLVHFYNDNVTDAMFDCEIEDRCSKLKLNFNKFWNETCLT